MITPIINHYFFAMAWTIAHSIWQICLITLIAAFIILSAQAKTARYRYNILCIACLAIFMSSAYTFYHYYEIGKAFKPEVITLDCNFTKDTPIVNNGDTAIKPLESTGTFGNVKDGFSNFINQNIFLFIMIWFVGLIMALIRTIGDLGYVYFLRNNMVFAVDDVWEGVLNDLKNKMKIDKVIGLMESAYVKSPLVLGHFKPLILFPIGALNRLDVQEVEAILAHELAHIYRKDFITNLVINIFESLFYFHPLIWWISKQIRIEREHCCDDIAIETTGDKIQYAKTLVRVHEMAMYVPNIGLAFAGSNKKNELTYRVTRMFSKESAFINPFVKSIASVTTFIFVAFVGLTAFSKKMDGYVDNMVSETGGFLKYDMKGYLDSMYLDVRIHDGEYEYQDDLYEVKLSVANNQVTSFILNGLPIFGQDMKKFKSLIEHTLLSSAEESMINEEGNMEGGNSIEIEAGYMDKFGTLIEDLATRGKIPQSKRLVDLKLYSNQLLVDNKKLDQASFQKFIDQYESIFGPVEKSNDELLLEWKIAADKNGVMINENIGISDNGREANESEILKIMQQEKNNEIIKRDAEKVRRDADKVRRDSDKVKRDANKVRRDSDKVKREASRVEDENTYFITDENMPPPPPPPPAPDPKKSKNKGSYHSDSYIPPPPPVSTNKFQNWLINNLKKEGYIDSENYMVHFSNRELRVNGQLVKSESYDKALQKYKELVNGNKDLKGSTFNFTFNNIED